MEKWYRGLLIMVMVGGMDVWDMVGWCYRR